MALSIGKAWDDSRAVLKRDGRLLGIVAAAMILLPVALQGTIEPQNAAANAPRDQSAIVDFVVLALVLLTLVGQLAIGAVALRRGITVGSAIATGFKMLLPVLAVVVMIALPVLLLAVVLVMTFSGQADLQSLQAQIEAGQLANAGGLTLALLLLIVTVLVVGVKVMLAIPVGIADEAGPFAMLKRSWLLTKGHFWKLLAFVILFGIGALVLVGTAALLAGLLSAIALGAPEPMSVSAMVMGLLTGAVQALVTVVYMVMLCAIYRQLEPAKDGA